MSSGPPRASSCSGIVASSTRARPSPASSSRLDTFTNEDESRPHGDRPVFVDLKNLRSLHHRAGRGDPRGGEFATENFRRALLFAQNGEADAVCFTPFNKAAMRLAYPGYDDEIRFVQDVLGLTAPGQRVQRPRRPLERPRHLAHSPV